MSRVMTLDEAISGLAMWGAQTWRDDPHFSVFAWQPTSHDIDAAANAGATLPRFQLERLTGDHGLAGIYEYLNAHGWSIPRVEIASHQVATTYSSSAIADAAHGLAEWGHETIGDDPHFALNRWSPTQANIERAHADGMTWSYAEWEAATGYQGLDGIHAALNAHGFQIRRATLPDVGR